MSKIEVNTVDVKCGSTLTLGSSGKTVTIASGASTSGMGRSGTVDWQTSSIKTDTFTASDGEGYFVDTSDGSPFKNYTVTVTTGTLYIVGGSGNVYHLDGSQQTAITMLANKTYRFTQSDSSNDGHQLIISTSNSTTLGTFQAGIVSSGITYYIDGSATQSNWLNSTTFNAGTTRYVEFKPSTTGTYYFGCYNHGIGMGGAITVSQQTVNLPSGSAGTIVSVADYTNTFQTNNLKISPNGTDKIGGVNTDVALNTEGQSVTLIYVDGTEGWKNIQDSTSNVVGNPNLVATGGSVTTSGNYKIHSFTSPGTFSVTNASTTSANNTVSYLVVAGGASGGAAYGGGGGAGGFREYKGPADCYTASPLNGNPGGTAVTVSAQSYPITVGAGGAPVGYSPAAVGNSGSASIFSTITSAGGGGGGAGVGSPFAGLAGGSGGGAGRDETTNNGAGNTPPTVPPQGNAGGTPSGSSWNGGGGGGGATAVGGNGSGGSPSSEVAGNGGAGGTTSITASPVAYAGGGGGSISGSNCSGGLGGTGGGGSGNTPGRPTASAGTTNTGGAGGGGHNAVSGAGGSGIVIIRYKFQ